MRPLSSRKMRVLFSLLLDPKYKFVAAVTMEPNEEAVKIERQSVFNLNQWQECDLDTFRARVSTDAAEFADALERLKNGECVPSISGTFLFRMKQEPNNANDDK